MSATFPMDVEVQGTGNVLYKDGYFIVCSDQSVINGKIGEGWSKTPPAGILVYKDGRYTVVNMGEISSYINSGWSTDPLSASQESSNGKVTVAEAKAYLLFLLEGFNADLILNKDGLIDDVLTDNFLKVAKTSVESFDTWYPDDYNKYQTSKSTTDLFNYIKKCALIKSDIWEDIELYMPDDYQEDLSSINVSDIINKFYQNATPEMKRAAGNQYGVVVTEYISSLVIFGSLKLFSPEISQQNVGGKKIYYQVTSKERAQEIMRTGQLSGQEFEEVYAFSKRPTLSQAKLSGARYYETVIAFETEASFINDPMINGKLAGIAKISARPGPISINNVQEVGYYRPWYLFWKR